MNVANGLNGQSNTQPCADRLNVESEPSRTHTRLGEGAPTGTAVRTMNDDRQSTRSKGAPNAEAVLRLTCGIAHDFNNLLTIIRGCADELRNRIVSREARDLADQIVRAADRGAALTRDLFALGQNRDFPPAEPNHAQRNGVVRQVPGRLGTDLKSGNDRDEVQREGRTNVARSTPGKEGKTVLVVEDETNVRALIRLALQRDGFEVQEAEDGAEALMVLERYQGPIEILVTDLNMPGMTGQQLATEVRRTRPGLRILYVSGSTEDSRGAPLVNLGDAMLLTKPFTLTALRDKIREVLSQPG